jgi:hypothetical protein
VRRNPPVRVEFEHAHGLGGLGETMAACRNKPTFGQFLGVFPVDRCGSVVTIEGHPLSFFNTCLVLSQNPGASIETTDRPVAATVTRIETTLPFRFSTYFHSKGSC